MEVAAFSDALTARVLSLAQANRELETFSYTVSHDLRTPLTIIENYAHTLRHRHAGELGPEATKALDGIHGAVQRMSLLIQNILHMSRVARVPRREAIDLATMARSLLAELREREPLRKVHVAIPRRLPAVADPAIVRIILANLLGNAWKFTSRKRTASIEVGRTTRNGVPAFFVRDNGVGFDMREAGRLFELFQRLHAEADFPGTGIGLATVARAVRRHDGAIWAQATPGRGATFTFTLGPESARKAGGAA